MKFHKQRFRHNPARGIHSDCHRAALASVFDLELDDVPNFADGNPSAADFNTRVETWLGSRNVTAVNIPFAGSLTEALYAMDHASSCAFWIVGGRDSAGYRHTVVARRGGVIHDPSPDRYGALRPCADGFFWGTLLVLRDPEKLTTERAGVLVRPWRQRVADWWKRFTDIAVQVMEDAN